MISQAQRRQVVDTLSGFHGLCQGCPHNPTSCKTPCRPVRVLLAHENPGLMEKAYGDDKTGTIVCHDERARGIFRVSSMLDPEEGDGKRDEDIEWAFSTENGNIFSADQENVAIRTGIFIDHFFNKFSWDDIAVKYDVTQHRAVTMYNRAMRRVESVVAALQHQDVFNRFVGFSEHGKSNFRALPLRHQWFILHKLMQLRLSEIAKIYDTDKRNVHAAIKIMTDRIVSGNEKLLDPTDEEETAAMARVEKRAEIGRAVSKRVYQRRKVKNNPAKVNSVTCES